jgi:thymidine phosphorylase
LDQLALRGEWVEPGSILARIHAKNKEFADSVSEKLRTCFTISPTVPDPIPIIGELIE